MKLICPYCKETFSEEDLLDEPRDIHAKLSVLRERMCPCCEREVVLKNKFNYFDCFFFGLAFPLALFFSWDTEWVHYIPFLIILSTFIPDRKELVPLDGE